MFIDVLTDEGTLLAKVIKKTEESYLVQFLVFKNEYYKFEQPCFISHESISGFYDVDTTLESLGYTKISGNKYTLDESDYEPDDSEDSESESFSASSSRSNSDIDS